jgi:hypothetical protein
MIVFVTSILPLSLKLSHRMGNALFYSIIFQILTFELEGMLQMEHLLMISVFFFEKSCALFNKKEM